MTGGKMLTSFWLGHLHGDYLPQPEQLRWIFACKFKRLAV